MNQRQCPRFAIRLLGLFMGILSLGVAASAEWKEKVLYSFQGGSDGENPSATLVSSATGNLYGTTTSEGSQSCSLGCGTVFELAPRSRGGWKYSVLHRFEGASDGADPWGSLVLDRSVTSTVQPFLAAAATANMVSRVVASYSSLRHRKHKVESGSKPCFIASKAAETGPSHRLC
jgi:uncharacterized repeat protein (TIGR03803 family)